ncbi:MAG: hypothetical protein M1281_05795 [Chloroflexi bacterium]|nr:hypothetical protein [Chloroflexota bacterium]
MNGPNISYNLFGLQISEKEFMRQFQKAGNQERLKSVAMRVFLVDQLRHNVIFRQTPALSHEFTFWLLQNETISLQLYLLCTCIDALSGSEYIDFYEWLMLRDSNKNKTKYGYDGTMNRQILNQISGDLHEPKNFRSAVDRIFRESYQPIYGNRNSFLMFFNELPLETRQLLSRVYIISSLLTKEDISRELTDNKTIPHDIKSWNTAQTDWRTKELSDKIKQIADYFYIYYRNPYTHQAISFTPRNTTDWGEILMKDRSLTIEEGWDPIGDIIPYKNKYLIRRFWARTYEDEVLILRLVVAIGWRRLAGIPVEGDLTELFRTFQIRNEIMHYAIYELENIQLLQKQYFGDIHNEIFEARLSLPKFSLKFLLMVKQYLDNSTLESGLKNMIDVLYAEFEPVHKVVDDFNDKYKLVFPNTFTVESDPIQRATVLAEKDKLIVQIREILAKSSIQKLTSKLSEWFYLLVDRMK